VIFDLLRFLNREIDSNRNIESYYSDLDYPMTSSINSLFDENQGISFCNSDSEISLRKYVTSNISSFHTFDKEEELMDDINYIRENVPKEYRKEYFK